MTATPVQRPEPALSEDFRLLMSHFPAGVVAVTAVRDNMPVGLVVGSFFSVSLTPLLVGFSVARLSTSWPRIRRGSGGFCVNVLAADQGWVSDALAIPGSEKFGCVGWSLSPGGSPIITGALAYLDCGLEATHDAGDHVIVIGRVNHFRRLQATDPLVFYRRGYWSLAAIQDGDMAVCEQSTCLSGRPGQPNRASSPG